MNLNTRISDLKTTIPEQPDGLKEILSNSLNNAVPEVNRYDDTLEDLPTRQTYTSNERHAKISAEVLADRFGIGIERARQTIKNTLHTGTRSAILPLSRRYRSDRHYGTKYLNGKFATDTIHLRRKTLTGKVKSQIFSHKCGFNAIYHLEDGKGDSIGYSLRSFISDYGVPKHLTCDGHPSQSGRHTLFQKTIRHHGIKYHVSSPYRPNENPAEGSIREVKKRWYRMQSKKNIPDRLSDYGLKYICETGNLTANTSRYAKGRTPIEIITGETPDLSEYIDFGFYDWVYFRTNAGLGPAELGKWLGISHRVGKLMSYWILPRSGIPISVTTVQRVTNLEKQTEALQAKMNDFHKAVERKWKVTSTTLDHSRDQNVLSLRDEDNNK